MQTEELARQYRKYRNALKILTLVLIISVGFGIFYWQVTAAKAEVVETWGMADAKEININSKVAGRVVKIYVDEGAHVEQGQLIAKIDSDTQEPQQRSAQANLAAQYAQLQQVIISSRNLEETLNASLRAAQAREAQAKTALYFAAKDEARYRELLEAEAIPAQTYDAYRSKLKDAQADSRQLKQKSPLHRKISSKTTKTKFSNLRQENRRRLCRETRRSQRHARRDGNFRAIRGRHYKKIRRGGYAHINFGAALFSARHRR